MEGSIGTVLAYAGDHLIKLYKKNASPFYVVQPVIPTKGVIRQKTERIYITIHLSAFT